MATNSTTFEQVYTAVDRSGKASKSFSKNVEQASDKAFKANEKAAKSFEALKQAAIGAFTIIAGAVLKSMIDVENAYAVIRGQTGATGDALLGLKDDFLEVLGVVSNSTEEVAQVIGGFNARLGLTGRELQSVAEKALIVSRVLKEDVNGIVASTSRLFGDWSIATEDQSEWMDKLFRAAQKAGIGITGLAQKVVQFGAPLRGLGFELEDAIAIFAKWEVEGVNTEIILGSMKIALSKFADEGRNANEALFEVVEQIKAADGPTGDFIAKSLVGAEAMTDFADAARGGKFDFLDMKKAIQEGTDTINKAGEDTQTTTVRIQTAWNKLQTSIARSEGFQVLLDNIVTLVEGLTEIAGPALAFIGTAVDIFVKTIEVAGANLGVLAGEINNLIEGRGFSLERLGRIQQDVMDGIVAGWADSAKSIRTSMQSMNDGLNDNEDALERVTIATNKIAKSTRIYADELKLLVAEQARQQAALDEIEGHFDDLNTTAEKFPDIMFKSADALEEAADKMKAAIPTFKGVGEAMSNSFLESFEQTMRSIGDLGKALSVSFGEAFASGLKKVISNRLTETFFKTALGKFISIGIPIVGQLISTGINMLFSKLFGGGDRKSASEIAIESAERARVAIEEYNIEFQRLLDNVIDGTASWNQEMENLVTTLSNFETFDPTDILNSVTNAISEQEQAISDARQEWDNLNFSIMQNNVNTFKQIDALRSLKISLRETKRDLLKLAQDGTLTFTRPLTIGGLPGFGSTFTGREAYKAILADLKKAESSSGIIKFGAANKIIRNASPEARGLLFDLVEKLNTRVLAEESLRRMRVANINARARKKLLADNLPVMVDKLEELRLLLVDIKEIFAESTVGGGGGDDPDKPGRGGPGAGGGLPGSKSTVTITHNIGIDANVKGSMELSRKMANDFMKDAAFIRAMSRGISKHAKRNPGDWFLE